MARMTRADDDYAPPWDDDDDRPGEYDPKLTKLDVQ